jgi:hypothetical protein
MPTILTSSTMAVVALGALFLQQSAVYRRLGVLEQQLTQCDCSHHKPTKAGVEHSALQDTQGDEVSPAFDMFSRPSPPAQHRGAAAPKADASHDRQHYLGQGDARYLGGATANGMH